MKKPISPLRQRMLDDMTFRYMSPNTQKVYSSPVANFSAFRAPARSPMLSRSKARSTSR